MQMDGPIPFSCHPLPFLRWLTALTGAVTAIVLAVNSYLMYDLLRQQVWGIVFILYVKIFKSQIIIALAHNLTDACSQIVCTLPDILFLTSSHMTFRCLSSLAHCL